MAIKSGADSTSKVEYSMNIRFDEIWSEKAFDVVPDSEATIELARAVRRISGQSPTGAIDFRPLYRLAGARAIEARLGSADGGQEAMLTPLPEDRFGIAVDPTPPGGWRKIPSPLRRELRRHRFRFRIGHELGHTFFYARGHGQPRRHLFDSPTQEDFCDAFSRELLVPVRAARRAAPSPDGLLRLRAAHDVSLELAARALSAAQPDLAIGIWFGERDGGDALRPQWTSPGGPVDAPARSAKWIRARRQLVHVG
jgi:hypothetical protein